MNPKVICNFKCRPRLATSFQSLCRVVPLSLAMIAPISAQDATPPAPPPSAQGAAGASSGTAGSPAHNEDRNEKPVYRVGKDVTPPGLIYGPDPAYPATARRAGFQATVVVWLVVSPEGLPEHVKIQQGAGMGLDEAALDTVQTWRFRPSTLNGEPVPVMINVEVNFRLAGLEPDAPLHAPREARGPAPQFPGVDIATYPLVIHIDGENGVVANGGLGYEIVAEATLEDSAGERSFTMTCTGPKNHCLHLANGNYPARWKTENRELEVMGKDQSGTSWKQTQYSLKPDSASSQRTP